MRIQAIRIHGFAHNTFQVILFLMLLALLAAAGWYTYVAEKVANKSYSTVSNAVDSTPPTLVRNFKDCTNAGYMVTGSAPRVCTTPDGKKFTEQ